MKQRQIAVCSEKRGYAVRFAEYAGRRKGALFAVHGFSDSESLTAYLREHPVEILLFTEEMREKIAGNDVYAQNSEKIILLSESEYGSDNTYPIIYMLQSCDEILRQAADAYAESTKTAAGIAIRTRKMKRIGVYSPVARTGKTAFALSMGREAAKRMKTLYLNFEEYSGFGTLYHLSELTLSDLMYFLKQGKSDFAGKLEAVKRQMGNLDYIPPIKSPAEYAGISGEEWKLLLNMIERESSYEAVILDFGNLPAGLFELLDECDFIYTPTADDETAAAKLEQYKETLRFLGMDELSERTYFFQLPKDGDADLMAAEEGRRWSGG